MTGMSFDTSELDALAREFADADQRIARDRDKIGRKAAQNIKNVWNADAAKSRYFGISVSYDETVWFGSVYEAEVGPGRHLRANRLAGVAHFGGANGGGGTLGDPQRYADAEAPGLAQFLADAAERALLR